MVSVHKKEVNNLQYFEIENCFNQAMMNDFYHCFNYIRPHLLDGVSSMASVNPDGSSRKKAGSFFLLDMNPHSNIIGAVNDVYFNYIVPQIMDLKSGESVYSLYPKCNEYSQLVSYYRQDDDGYDYHADKALITFIMWFNNGEKNYTGGELYLPDHDITLQCNHNTGVVFPGHVQHGVKPIKIIDKSRDSGRISYTVFTGIKDETKD